MFLIHVTAAAYELIRPDGTTCATYPRSDDTDADDRSYAAIRDLQDAMNTIHGLPKTAAA